MSFKVNTSQTLADLQRSVIECDLCPRLVDYRHYIALKKRRMFMDWEYWGKPLPSFGDPKARALILGLAPAAHGANRTGRMFTGDRSGQWLFETLYKFGFARIPSSIDSKDGQSLKDIYISCVLRCCPPSNKPTPKELAHCLPYLSNEIALLPSVSIIIALGRVAFDSYLRLYKSHGKNRDVFSYSFGHGATYQLEDDTILIASYHPSQQNTQTGRLTREMFEQVFCKVRYILDEGKIPVG